MCVFGREAGWEGPKRSNRSARLALFFFSCRVGVRKLQQDSQKKVHVVPAAFVKASVKVEEYLQIFLPPNQRCISKNNGESAAAADSLTFHSDRTPVPQIAPANKTITTFLHFSQKISRKRQQEPG